jgi:PAS domain S-box-containing protein
LGLLPHSVKFDRYLLPAAGTGIATLGAAAGIAVAYFLAAQLGLSLLATPSDVAVFWPASGLAAGILIAAGRQVGMASVLGIVLGTVAANLLSDRSLATSILKGFCNAGEAILVAWLLERWFGRPFTFGDLRRVVGFFGAAALATATSAVGGAVIMTTLHTAAPFWDVWRTWFLSDAVGIVVVAPLLIELSQLRRELRVPGEVMEAAGALAVLGLASTYIAVAPTGSWLSFSPVCIVLPLLVWLAARVHRIFAIAGALLVSFPVICATTLGIGHFGDGAMPTMERVQGAQATVTMVTVFALVLSALFAERRRSEAELKRSEAELKQSNDRLQLALDCAELGTWSLHLNTGRFKNDVRDRRIHGHGQEGHAKTLAEMRSQVHPDDLSRLDAAFGELGHAGGRSCRTEYRLAPRTDEERAGRERWVAMEGTVVRRANGYPEQLLGVTRDITQRKHAEDALHQREFELSEAQRLAHIGSWYWDADADVLLASDEMLRIFGFDPATQCVLTFREQCSRWYPVDDWNRLKRAGEKTMQTGLSYELELRAFRNETPIWVTARGAVARNSEGQIIGLRGTIQDVTERKLAELGLAERNTQLELASRTARVGSFAIDYINGIVKLSPGCASVLGLPETTVEISRDDIRKLVHPEDLAELLDAPRNQAFLKKDSEFIVQFRIVRADDGEVRWVEARSLMFYDQAGQPVRLIAVIIDFTERKLAESALAERNLQLAIAGKVGRVGSYAYDVNAERLQVSEGYAALHGIPEGTTETTLSAWRARVHPEDLDRVEGAHSQAVADKRREYSVEYRIVRPNGEVRWTERRCLISYDGDGRAQRVVGVSIDITERKQAEKQRNALNAELDHRVKNVLATVCAIIFQTQNANATIEDFVASVDRRIKSLASTHELLSHARWHGVLLQEIIRREFAPYSAGKADISGPRMMLKPEAAQAMAMVFHELATNAAKYGALSNHTGWVSVRWLWLPNGIAQQRLAIEWQEIGGPPVSAPSASGYGTTIIRDLIPYEFGGRVDLVFALQGVRCHVELPADWLSDAAADPVSGSLCASIELAKPDAGYP